MSAQGKLIGYARVSTDTQKTDLQFDALRAAGVDDRSIYTDVASGGRGSSRPGFEAMWRDLRADDQLVVWKLDRLGRSVSELIFVAERIEKLGAHLRVLTEAIDTTTTMGRFTFHILAAMAQMERDLIIERTKAGQAAGRKRGKKPGRKTVLTGQVADDAVRRLLAGQKPVDVAEALKISKSTLYHAINGVLAPRLLVTDEGAQAHEPRG